MSNVKGPWMKWRFCWTNATCFSSICLHALSLSLSKLTVVLLRCVLFISASLKNVSKKAWLYSRDSEIRLLLLFTVIWVLKEFERMMPNDAPSGGIIAREACEISSLQFPERLQTKALVKDRWRSWTWAILKYFEGHGRPLWHYEPFHVIKFKYRESTHDTRTNDKIVAGSMYNVEYWWIL